MDDIKEIDKWIARIMNGWPGGPFVQKEGETEDLVKMLRRMKSDRIKINIMSRHNAKLAGMNIDQVDVRGLKELLGEKWTNGDRIRSMTDKQLADELIHHDCKRHCKNYNDEEWSGKTCLTEKSCSKGIVEWLESEVKE